jgi:hypothetical protein
MDIDKIKKIVLEGTVEDKLHLYGFNGKTPEALVVEKFFIFARANFSRFFGSKSCEGHREAVLHFLRAYRGGEDYVVLAYRGFAKTALKKLFDVFVILNDGGKVRKYFKILCKDFKNSRAVVTDVYNLLLEMSWLYGDVFGSEAGDKRKREETMAGFVLADGRKYVAGTIGQTQRGHIQDAYRPDYVWFDDIEDRESIGSSSVTQANIGRMAEAIDGLAKGGQFVVTGNYISDQGAVQWFLNKPGVKRTIVPIVDDFGKPTWPERYTVEDVEELKGKSDDFGGEFLCDPMRSTNKFFDLERVEGDMRGAKLRERESAGFRYWGKYQPHHKYGMASDHSDGIGKDSNALALFDFTTGELLVTYANNKISPDLAAFEFARIGGEFGNCLYGPEINAYCGGTVIATLKGLNYPSLFRHLTEDKSRLAYSNDFGWKTTSKTKRQAFFEFRRDYNDGKIKIYDVDVLKEMKGYTNSNLQDETVGLITRHFDLLMATVIAWQMHKYAEYADVSEKYGESMEKYINS